LLALPAMREWAADAANEAELNASVDPGRLQAQQQ
jgi:hypothetical protein